MPISAYDGRDEHHWATIKSVFLRAIDSAGFQGRLVSDSAETRLIHGAIVENLLRSDIVLCDVSARNPNVMFELGLRLARDLPVVIVKDDETPFSFDVGGIEHLPYPRSLLFAETDAFLGRLTKKLQSTYEASRQPGYQSFFRTFAPAAPVSGAARKWDEGVPYYDWPFIGELIHKIHRLTERGFAPDVIVTMSGPGSFAACRRLSLASRDVPLLVAVTFPRLHGNSTDDSLLFAGVAVDDGWISLATNKWDVYLPGVLRRYRAGTRVLLMDDRVITGITQARAREALESIGLEVRQAALVAPSALQSGSLDFVAHVTDGEFLFPWGPKSGRTS